MYRHEACFYIRQLTTRLITRTMCRPLSWNVPSVPSSPAERMSFLHRRYSWTDTSFDDNTRTRLHRLGTRWNWRWAPCIPAVWVGWTAVGLIWGGWTGRRRVTPYHYHQHQSARPHAAWQRLTRVDLDFRQSGLFQCNDSLGYAAR